MSWGCSLKTELGESIELKDSEIDAMEPVFAGRSSQLPYYTRRYIHDREQVDETACSR